MIAELIGFFAIILFFLVVGGFAGWMAHGTASEEYLQNCFMSGWEECAKRQQELIEKGTLVYRGEDGKWIGRMMSLVEIAAQVEGNKNFVDNPSSEISMDGYKMPDESEQVNR